MPIIKEYKQFFLRNVQVNSGAVPDKEVGYPLQYSITGKGNVYNRLLQGHYPSEGVFRKLLESITFKLNVEDTANTTEQGLSRLATDAEAETRTDNGVGLFENVIKPHHLPDVVAGIDIYDVKGTPIQGFGLTVTPVRRTVSGKFWRNFLIELSNDKSITVNNLTNKVELVGDLTTPGNNKMYGTDGTGAKGWLSIPVQTLPIYYSIYASYINSTGTNTGNSINEYTLHTESIQANALLDDGDEVKYELTGLYTDSDSLSTRLYVNGVLVRGFNTVSTDPVYMVIEYTIVYKGTNQAFLITKAHKYSDAGSSTEVYFDTIAFNPTAINPIEFKVLTTALGANQFSLKRAKVTYGKIL